MPGLWEKALLSVPSNAQEAKGYKNSRTERSTLHIVDVSYYFIFA